jgi:Uma2 family endonuclease
MVQFASNLLTADEFIIQYGDCDRYELIDGELIEMEPTGTHEQVSAFIGRKLNVEIDRQDFNYFIPHRCLIKLLGTDTAFRPDVILLDKSQLINEPLWQKEPVITLGNSVKLIAEVVSTNWQNDYARKAVRPRATCGRKRKLATWRFPSRAKFVREGTRTKRLAK